MIGRQQSVVNLDAIDRKKKLGFIGRLLISRWSGGQSIVKSEPYGHYMFCGSQGSGKSTSILWYAQKLRRKYKRRRISYFNNETQKYVKFKQPPQVKFYSNVDLGIHIDKSMIFDTIDGFDPYANEVRIVFLDEIHTYFPKGMANKETQQLRDDLIAIFSQLRKRNTYILSSAQIYGRLDKSLREQCLYMVDCSVNRRGRLVNEFIPEKDIICDELGRWAGNPKYIYIHGLSTLQYDTKKIIRE